MSIENLKAKNAREWKHAPEKEKIDYSWFLKEKYQGNLDSIHLYCATLAYLKKQLSLIRIIARYLFGGR